MMAAFLSHWSQPTIITLFLLLCTATLAYGARGGGSFSEYFSSLGGELGEMLDVVDKVASTIDNIDFSGNNDCTYECRHGLTAVPNRDYIPTVDGCGSFGIQISLHDLPQLTKCCNEHDICYDSCGAKKSTCDKNLQHCAHEVCLATSKKYGSGLLAQPACQTLGEMLYKTTSVLGCEPFRSAQKKACQCVTVDYRNEL